MGTINTSQFQTSSDRSKKLVVATNVPFSEHQKRIFYLDELREKGCDVEYWDLSPLFPGDQEPGYGETIDTVLVNSLHDLGLQVARACIAVKMFIVQLTPESQHAAIFKCFRQCDVPIVWFDRPGLPSVSIADQFLIDLKNLEWIERDRVRLFDVAKSCFKVVRHLKRIFFSHFHFDIVFAAGAEAVDKRQGKRVVKVNHHDYDQVFRGRSYGATKDDEYIVFLDEGMSFHPDNRILGLQTVPPDRYYPDLNRFFTKLESITGFKVKIALHPKLTNRDEHFEERPLFKGETADLVAHSRLVLAHASTSVSYAVLFKKPVMFLLSVEMERYLNRHRLRICKRMAAELGRPVVRFDTSTDDDIRAAVERSMDPIAYDRYEKRYLVSRPQIPTWKTLLEELGQECKK